MPTWTNEFNPNLNDLPQRYFSRMRTEWPYTESVMRDANDGYYHTRHSLQLLAKLSSRLWMQEI